MLKINTVLFTLLFLISGLVWSTPVIRPPSEKITFEQYQFLLRQVVSQTPELAELWTWTHKHQLQGYYLGGGILRGLLKWLNTEIQNYSYDEILKHKVPGIHELLIVKSADKDLYIPDNGYDPLRAWKPYADWDLLKNDFYQNTIRNKGSTLDKVAVNPGYHGNSGINDPLNALRALYHGQLTFVLPDDISQIPVVVSGDTRLGLAMRFLRFMNDLKEVAEPTPESMALVKKSIAEEKHLIPAAEAEFPAWPKENPTVSKNTQVRIGRNVSSLYKSLGKDAFTFIKFLKQYDLYQTLAENHYGLPDRYDNPAQQLYKFREHGLTHEDIHLFGQMTAWDINRALSFHRFLLEHAQNEKEVIRSFRPLWKTQSEAYMRDLNSWMATVQDKVIERIGFKNWTADEWKDFETTFSRYSDYQSLLQKAKDKSFKFRDHGIYLRNKLTSTASTTELLKILRELQIENKNYISDAYLASFDEAFIPKIVSFDFNTMTLEEIRSFELAIPSIKSNIAFKRAAVNRAGRRFSPTQILASAFPTVNDSYRSALAKLKDEMLDLFHSEYHKVATANACALFYKR